MADRVAEQPRFIPYSTQSISESDVEAVAKVLRSDWLTQGPTVPAFEQQFAALHNVSHAIAINSATAGLHVACLALGLKPGGLVWTSPISFVASANCALYCGADVDFVDIDQRTRNMSVVALETKLRAAALTGRLPDIVIPVDFSGLPCDRREIRALADAYGFKVLVDASHSVGAHYLGAVAGNAFAHASVFSFHAVKIVTTAEGGMIATDLEDVAHRARLLRSHGITKDPNEMGGQPEGPWYYQQIELGFNFRMTDLQAALGLNQLGRLREFQSAREGLALRYDERLRGLPVTVPLRASDRASSHHLYVIELDAEARVNRRDVYLSMKQAGIGVNVHYIPIHTQPFYRMRGFHAGMFPSAETYYSRALSIPLFPDLQDSDLDRVVFELKRVLT